MQGCITGPLIIPLLTLRTKISMFQGLMRTPGYLVTYLDKYLLVRGHSKLLYLILSMKQKKRSNKDVRGLKDIYKQQRTRSTLINHNSYFICHLIDRLAKWLRRPSYMLSTEGRRFDPCVGQTFCCPKVGQMFFILVKERLYLLPSKIQAFLLLRKQTVCLRS